VITKEQRRRIAEQAGHRCGYCQTQEVVSGIPLTIEHIIPRAKGGSDDDSNLWLSCRLCNEKKGSFTEGIDPTTNIQAPLFHPRRQNWSDHFVWSEDGTQIVPKTEIGHVTIITLALNDELRVRARGIWAKAGYHPPNDDSARL
jgi:hypothetical protein